MKHLFKLSVCLILLLCLAACLGVSASAEGKEVSGATDFGSNLIPGSSSSASGYYNVASGSYILKTDVLLDGYLKIESGKEVIIDLNGHKLYRNHSSALINGCVICVEGTLTITDSAGGGSVTGGNASSSGTYRAGGVSVDGGAFTLNGGSITGNTSASGCGVFVDGGAFTLNDGSITDNTCSGNGGGVSVKGGTFTMNDGSITNNMSSSNGGGVYVGANGMFAMTGGSITGNTCSGNGGGVYMYSSASFSVYGSPLIRNNKKKISATNSDVNNVYNAGTNPITVTGALGSGARIGMYQSGVAAQAAASYTLTEEDAARFHYDRNSTSAEYAARLRGNQVTLLKINSVYTGSELISVSTDKAAEGDTVTVSVDPAYLVTSLSVTDLYNNPVTVTDNSFTMPASSATVTAEFGTRGWIALQELLDAGGDTANTDNRIILGQGALAAYTDILAISDDAALTVPSGKTVTLDLNGHTIDRRLTAAQDDGCVIYVSGTLTVMDSSVDADHPCGLGRITGGFTTGAGGGVQNYGAFTLSGGSIAGNTSTYTGGGVFNSGAFTMSGGSVTGNTSGEDGGGVYMAGGTFKLSGGAVIRDNTGNGTANNVYLPDGETVTLTDALTGDDSIGVTMETPGTFTVGLPTKSQMYSFVSDDGAYGVYLRDGEAAIGTLYAVTIDPGLTNGSVEADTIQAGEGQTVTLDVSPAVGCVIDTVGYHDGSNHEIAPSESVYSFTMPAQNVTVTALFRLRGWPALQRLLDAGGDTTNEDNKIILGQGALADYTDITAIDGDAALTVPAGKTVTMDLNGHTIDRRLTSVQSEGSVILVSGTLTVTDSSIDADHPCGVGSITGGRSDRGGGVYVNDGGAFTLSGGSIANNSSSVSGGGVYVDTNGTFTLSGGSLTGNSAKYGGGVYNKSMFTMSDGSLVGNTVSHDGGGLYNAKTFILSGGSITGNSAKDGGGMFNEDAFTMSGGSITGNSATNSGGGVYKAGFFTMSGGSVTGNSAGNKGGGVYDISRVFNLSGSVVIRDNTRNDTPSNLHLARGVGVVLTGALTEDASIGVTMELKGGFTNGLSGNASLSNFVSDESAYGLYIRYNEAAIGTLYPVTIDPSITNGSVTADVSRTGERAIVTLAVRANEGYTVNKVCYNDGSEHTITPANGVYSFKMPGSAVTVTASFTALPFKLPASLKSIGESAFEGLPVAVVEIPDGCESIGKWAFKGCTGLTEIRVPASVTEIDDTAFDGCEGVTVYGTANSEAERIATLYGFAFADLEQR